MIWLGQVGPGFFTVAEIAGEDIVIHRLQRDFRGDRTGWIMDPKPIKTKKNQVCKAAK